MQLPIVSSAPSVTEHAQAFRHLCSDHPQFQHFEDYLPGLVGLENKRLVHISRCPLNGEDTANISRCLSEAPWHNLRS